MKSIKKIITVFIIFVSLCQLAACGGNDTEYTQSIELVLIGGFRANSAVVLPNFDTIEEALLSGGKITFISNDSKNDLVQLQLNTNIRKRLLQRNAEKGVNTLTQLLTSPVTTEECNLYSALDKAAMVLQNSDADIKKLIICDSMLPTDGAIIANNFISGNTNEYITFLQNNLLTVDLSNVDITVYGLAQTASPQSSISNIDKEHMTQFWDSYFNMCNALSVSFKNDISVDLDRNGLPYVTLIETTSIPEYTKLNTSLFEVSTDVPKDINAFNSEVNKIKSHITQNDISSIEIYGTTSSEGEYSTNKSLGFSRAERVAEELDELNIDINIYSYVGEESPYYVSEVDPETQEWSEVSAEKNRAIYIVYK